MMKRCGFLMAMFLMGLVSAMAQDTIILRSGDMLEAQVREVSDSELKYTLWAEPDGPTYVKRVSDIFMVRYRSGRREVYDVEAAETSAQRIVPVAQQASAEPQKPIIKSMPGMRMARQGGALYLGNSLLDDQDVLEIFGPEGMQTYISACHQSNVGGINLTMGIFEAVGGLVMVAYGVNQVEEGHDDAAVLSTIGLLLCVAADIQIPIGCIFSGIGHGRLNWLANEYNTAYSVADNVSLSVALVCAPELGGTRTVAPGLGISLRF